MDQSATIDGLEFKFTPPSDRDQFRIECLLARLLAPAAALGVGLLAEGLAVEVVKLARELCLDTAIAVEGDVAESDPPSWDFARLLHLRDRLDSTDPRLKKAWDASLERLPKLAGELISSVTPEVTDRAQPEDLITLFELVVLGHVFLEVDGKPSKLSKWSDITLLSRGRPGIKWELLRTALAATYLAPEPELEHGVDEDA